MASSLIHIAIAKRVLEKSDIEVKDQKDYFLGAIAPDIAKQIGLNRDVSHFIINTKTDVPNTNIFIKRYPYFKYNSFDLGYFTHLYADKVWFGEFIPNRVENCSIKLLDGTIMKTSPQEITEMIYADYTNLNTLIIEEYDLELSLFYEEFKAPKTNITEIPVDKLDILINKMGILVENAKKEKTYLIDMIDINKYIEETANEIIEILKKY